MIRLFDQFSKRDITLLDGVWRFNTDPKKVGVTEKWFEIFPETSIDMVVPSCWNNQFGYFQYDGLAWYQTTFTSSKATNKLVFHGISGQAEVYVDGEHVGSHYGGFTGFEVLLKDFSEGNHTLTISVDSEPNDLNTIPLIEADWFHYGGVTRSVELMPLDDAWIDTLKIDYVLSPDLSAVDVTCAVTFGSVVDATDEDLALTIDGQKVFTGSVTVADGSTVTLQHRIDAVTLWHTNNPHLYVITAAIDEDCYTDRIGFRKIEAKDRKILLNGEELYLQGVNRHEEHPDFGFSMPFQLMKKDLDIIKYLGCNMIRGSHYPNAPIFLDLMDQEGMLFWEEIPMWGFKEHQLANEITIERGLMMHEEMIKRDYHHPCVIMWGLHNEVDTDTDAGYNITRIISEKVRSLDSSRPITYATNRADRDICLEFADIIGINKYIGWYFQGLDDWPAYLQNFYDKTAKEGIDDKPIIMSEFGAGAVAGSSSFESPKWSENFQSDYLDFTLGLYKSEKRINGALVWQYCDIRGSKWNEMGRPRNFNNKGLVNEYRQPKRAFDMVKHHFSS